jgi:subtilisin family serine protease
MNRPIARSWSSAAALTAGILTCLMTAPVTGQGARSQKLEKIKGHDAVAGDVIVKFRGAPSPSLLAIVGRQIDEERHERVGSRGAYLFHSKGFAADAVIRFLSQQPDVEFAEPNYLVHADDTVPNDTRFSELWGFSNSATPGADIGAVKAWDVSTGTSSVVVGVIDTGVDYNHQDLSANIWSAPTSFTVNISGTNFTCPTGSHGFNAITNTCDPMDDNDHGTHVSGTIGAVGNNSLGVVGVNWTTRIIGAKFLSSSGSGSTANAIRAIEFLVQAKQIFGASANVRVLSNSWGGGGFSQALLDEINIANANGMLFVAAAGNSTRDNDAVPFYPASYDAPNVIAVAATDQHDALASFSNYGAESVDLGAPGIFVLSTTRNNTYKSFSGTSMATPHVSGTAALVLSKCALNTAALKSNLLANVTPLASMASTLSGGRLNADASLRSCAAPVPIPTPPSAPTALGATAGDGQVNLAWTGLNDATSYSVKRGSTSGGPYSTVAAGLAPTSYRDNSVINGTTYYYVVTGSNGAGESGNSNEAVATPKAVALPQLPAAPSSLKISLTGKKKIALTWNGSTNATGYNVKRSTTASGPYVTVASGVTSTTYTNAGLRNRTTYYFVVSAVNGAGESANSSSVSIFIP